jgi:hypothetical protein
MAADSPDLPNLITRILVSSLMVEVFVYAPKSAAPKHTLSNLSRR